jgi:hypothetical protein
MGASRKYYMVTPTQSRPEEEKPEEISINIIK